MSFSTGRVGEHGTILYDHPHLRSHWGTQYYFVWASPRGNIVDFEHSHRRMREHGTFACEHLRPMTLKLVSARATPQPQLRAQTSSDSRDFCSVEMRSSSSTSMPLKVKHGIASLIACRQVISRVSRVWFRERAVKPVHILNLICGVRSSSFLIIFEALKSSRSA